MVQKKLLGLQQSSQQKKQVALDKTQQAIAKLKSEKQKITIRSVAREAGVSVSYIYKYPELSYQIQKLKEEQKYSLVLSVRQDKQAIEEFEILRQEKMRLQQENAELKNIINLTKTGKSSSIKELKTENIRLLQENIRLKKELEYTLKTLQSAREFILEQSHADLERQENELEIKKVRQISEE